MAASFSRTLRSLRNERPRRSALGLLLVVVLLAGWASWMVLARLTVYEVSNTARLEVRQQAHNVQASVGGQVVATHLELGARVEQGALLLELNAEQENLELGEKQAALQSLRARLEALEAAIGAERQVLEVMQGTRLARVDELSVQLHEVRLKLAMAEKIMLRWETIHGTTGLSELDMLRAQAETLDLRGQTASLDAKIRAVEQEERVKASVQQAQIKELETERARLEGELGMLEATRQRLEQRISARVIRAPLSGTLGEIGDVQLGSVVNVGQRVAAIIPDDSLKIVAYFAPEAALGRVQPGQTARLRLYGFSWTQYGTIAAIVEHVAGEPRDLRVRVELAPQQEDGSRIPLQHGLPGTVEIALEQISPLELLLRGVGKLLEDAPAGAAETQQ